MTGLKTNVELKNIQIEIWGKKKQKIQSDKSKSVYKIIKEQK